MSVQYDLYLEQHKGNVLKGLRWIQENLPDIAVGAVEWQIEFAHDESKSHSDEYEAYDAYFYGGNRSYKVVQDFNKAWLLHIHRNPHHWQYWVLIHDDPDEDMTILDMPYNYILEMICDWWSFSWQKKNLFEIFKWYDEHKDYIKLSDKTRKTVEKILTQINEKLIENASESELMHHGVKGQKWGVQNGPPYPIDRSNRKELTNATGQVIIEVDHNSLTGPANGVTQVTNKNGGIDRNYYDESGKQKKQISNNDHGNPKHHDYGDHGEHAHDYIYDENGQLVDRPIRELNDEERKENSDIL